MPSPSRSRSRSAAKSADRDRSPSRARSDAEAPGANGAHSAPRLCASCWETISLCMQGDRQTRPLRQRAPRRARIPSRGRGRGRRAPGPARRTRVPTPALHPTLAHQLPPRAVVPRAPGRGPRGVACAPACLRLPCRTAPAPLPLTPALLRCRQSAEPSRSKDTELRVRNLSRCVARQPRALRHARRPDRPHSLPPQQRDRRAPEGDFWLLWHRRVGARRAGRPQQVPQGACVHAYSAPRADGQLPRRGSAWCRWRMWSQPARPSTAWMAYVCAAAATTLRQPRSRARARGEQGQIDGKVVSVGTNLPPPRRRSPSPGRRPSPRRYSPMRRRSPGRRWSPARRSPDRRFGRPGSPGRGRPVGRGGFARRYVQHVGVMQPCLSHSRARQLLTSAPPVPPRLPSSGGQVRAGPRSRCEAPSASLPPSSPPRRRTSRSRSRSRSRHRRPSPRPRPRSPLPCVLHARPPRRVASPSCRSRGRRRGRSYSSSSSSSRSRYAAELRAARCAPRVCGSEIALTRSPWHSSYSSASSRSSSRSPSRGRGRGRR